jgi:acetolactate synthase-1/2/3 large subunit
MIKVSDYIARRIAELGVKHVFLVTGGGAMHLNDSVGRCRALEYVCNHHEQASAMAAEAYARVTGNIGVVMVTSGPGGTNALTGVLGCWLDSIPALFISGQVRYSTTAASTSLPLRQLGDQEANIVAIVGSITKYAVMVRDPKTIRYHFDRAAYLARSGRPGPVWLDIPLDVQSAMVDEESLARYRAEEDPASYDRSAIPLLVAGVLERVRDAERPLLLAGGGIRLSGAAELFLELVEVLNIPVQTAIGAADLIASDHRLFFGRPSVTGDRSSNFIIQNCDLLLAVGARLWVRQISYNFDAFAREAYKVSVDVDAAELHKPTIRLDLPIHCDAKLFLEELARQLGGERLSPKTAWLAWCAERRRRYPSVLPEYREQKEAVNSFHFVEVLSRCLSADDTIVLADGLANTCTLQAISLKKGQRLFTNSGSAPMGYDLPAAIGACLAKGKKRVVCIAGDGSIQLNIQELQTVVARELPIKIFLFSNDGYASIRATQDAYFGGHYMGADASSGVTIPDMVRVATAYGLRTETIATHAGMEARIRAVLEAPGPWLCDVRLSARQGHLPRLASEVLPDGTLVSKPLEDMYPFLDRAEFMENMLVQPWRPAGPAAANGPRTKR